MSYIISSPLKKKNIQIQEISELPHEIRELFSSGKKEIINKYSPQKQEKVYIIKESPNREDFHLKRQALDDNYYREMKTSKELREKILTKELYDFQEKSIAEKEKLYEELEKEDYKNILLQKEVDKLKEKSSIEKESLIKEIDIIKKSKFNSFKYDYEIKIKNLEEENSRLNFLLNKKLEELDYERKKVNYSKEDLLLKEKIHNLELILTQKTKELDEVNLKLKNILIIQENEKKNYSSSNIVEMEEKISVLSTELTRINSLYQNLLIQNGELKKTNESLLISTQELSFFKQKYNEQIVLFEKKTIEFEELKAKFILLESEPKKVLPEKENVTVFVKDSKENNEKLNVLIEEINMWKNKFLSKEIEFENLKLSETREKELLLSIDKFSNELLIWKNKAMRLELESKDFIKKDEEINLLKIKINDLSKEILFLKSKNVEKTIDHTDFTSLNDQISKHLKEIMNLREIISQKELIIKNLQISNSVDNNYNYELNSLKIEIENLRKQIIHKDEEIIKIKSNTSVHITDRKLIEELESWKHRCKYLENRENNNGKLIDYEQKIEYLTKELDMIRIQLNVKINEYNDIFYKYNEIKNNSSYKLEFEQKISYLTRELDTCKYELSSKITEYNNLLYQFNEIKSKNNTQISTSHYYKSDSKTDLLNLEIIKLQKTLKEKNQEIEYLKKTYSSFISKNSKEKSIIKYEETISLLQREIQEWKEKVANSNKYTSINFTNSVSENKEYRELKILNEEIRSLKQIIITYEQEIETWKIKYLKLEKDIHEFAQIKNQEKEINLSHEKNSPSKTMKTSYVEHEIIRKNEIFSADNQFENKYFEKKYY